MYLHICKSGNRHKIVLNLQLFVCILRRLSRFSTTEVLVEPESSVKHASTLSRSDTTEQRSSDSAV